MRHDLKIIPLCTIYKPPNTIIAKHKPNPGQSILLLNFSYRKSLRNNQNSAPYESLLTKALDKKYVFFRYEEKVYVDWTHDVGSISQGNLDKPLVIRDPNTKLIKVNFDPQV